MFWIYVELFHLLLYKYFYGSWANADRRGTVAINVFWWQQPVITDVWFWPGTERTYSQRPTVICQRKLIMNLLIVESPSKAKTIEKYLGAGWHVVASVGHVRDLVPENGSVDTENNFQMRWQIMPGKEKQLKIMSPYPER